MSDVKRMVTQGCFEKEDGWSGRIRDARRIRSPEFGDAGGADRRLGGFSAGGPLFGNGPFFSGCDSCCFVEGGSQIGLHSCLS